MDKLIELVNSVLNGIKQLEDKPEITEKLRGNNLLPELKNKMEEFLKTHDYLGINQALQLYKSSNIASLEGEDTFGSTIWNASVVVRGKSTTLENLLNELDDEWVRFDNDQEDKNV